MSYILIVANWNIYAKVKNDSASYMKMFEFLNSMCKNAILEVRSAEYGVFFTPLRTTQKVFSKENVCW